MPDPALHVQGFDDQLPISGVYLIFVKFVEAARDPREAGLAEGDNKMAMSGIVAGVDAEIEKPEEKRPLSAHTRFALKLIGGILVPIGFAGVILPVLPGVPLLILAAACFARSSPRLERWLVTHPVLGPGILAWREHGAISLKSKFLAFSMMTMSGTFMVMSGAPVIAKFVCIAGMLGAALFIGTRPNH